MPVVLRSVRLPLGMLSVPQCVRAWLEVDCSALRHNLSVVRKRAGVPLVAMVKADGYGAGAVGVAKALGMLFVEGDASCESVRLSAGKSNQDDIWGLGVASLGEAESLRLAGYCGRIFSPVPMLRSELPKAIELGVRPSLHLSEDIRLWCELGAAKAPWHLSIDTGMSRAGARWDRVDQLIEALRNAPPEGVFTHFHSADEIPTSMDEQDARFASALEVLRAVLPDDVLVHSDNSAAIVTRTHGPRGQLARPGIALYGGLFTAELKLRPVINLRARVIDVRDVLPGETVSYGATWTAERTHRVATLAVGYADGYRRHLSNRAEALLHGQRCRVLGRVTMDMTMVDVTGQTCALGDVVTFMGSDGPASITPEELAQRSGVSPYELLTGLGIRLPHFYNEVNLSLRLA